MQAQMKSAELISSDFCLTSNFFQNFQLDQMGVYQTGFVEDPFPVKP